MKHTQQMSMTTRVRQNLLLLLSLVCLSQGTFAQVQPPNPGFSEYPYPGPIATAGATNSHCYSRGGSWPCAPGGVTPWLLVNSWEFGGISGFAWQVVDQGIPWPGGIYEQGFMMMPVGATDLNVGLINTGATGHQIDISYYQMGVGHFVDVYDWNCPSAWGGPGGITLNFSNQLSCLPTYSRISMDSHKGYGTAIVWEDPTAGTDEIHVVAANMNAFGPPQRIKTTGGHITPEVAFVHSSGALEIHIASYDPASTGIEEYFVIWQDIIPGGANACPPPGLCNACPGLLPRTLMDVNAIGVAPNSLHIDAPDHYGTQNWAYTYEIKNDIFARVYNPNVPPWLAPAMGGAATVCFTDGSYVAPFYPPCCPMPVINPAKGISNTVPVICWDERATIVLDPNGSGVTATQQSFYVAWHTTFNDAAYNPTSDAYIGIQVNEDGLVRNPMPMPFNWMGASNVPGNISPTPTIALSEDNETANQMYATFGEFTTGNYIEHRWIPWNVGSFKPGHGTTITPSKFEMTVNPNPFKDKLTLDFSHDIEDEKATIRVTDIQGKEYGTYSNMLYGANDFLRGITKILVPGNYNISVECPRVKFQQVYKVTKLD